MLAVAGGTGTLGTQMTMGESWRVGVDPTERTTLVTDGPFSLARNPIFTMMLLAATGLSTIRGATYDHYAASVGRFVPLLGRRHDPRPTPAHERHDHSIRT